MASGFDPLASDEAMSWEAFEDCDCPDVDSVARAETTDVGVLKRACETQLKKQGIEVGAFVVDGNRAHFKTGSREEILAAKRPCKGHVLYVLSDPSLASARRIMKAVKGEGMPTFKNPFIHGNLFLVLKIMFPDGLTPEAQAGLKAILPPALNIPAASANGADVEVHSVQDMDPLTSQQQNKLHMASGSDTAYDED